MNESNKSEKINHSKSKKTLNQYLKKLKSLKKKLIIQEHEQVNQLNSFQQVIRELEQEKEKIAKQYEKDIELASIEIKLSDKGKFKVNPEFVEHAKSKVQGLEIERNQKIDIIQKDIDRTQGDVSLYQSFMKKDEGTHKIRHDIDEVTKKTFTEFKTYMINSSPFEEMDKKLTALKNDKPRRPGGEIADAKSETLNCCLVKLKFANSFSEWQEAINYMKDELTSDPFLSITRHAGTFFDCVNRSFEKSTKTVMQDFLGYNESKYDDLWYRAGTQTGPKNW